MSFTIREYFARPGSGLSDKDAQIIGAEVERLDAQGRSTARDLLNAAKHKESPLHPYVEWDDKKAAELYRLGQVRQITGSIMARVVDRNSDVHEVRGFFPIPQAEDAPFKPDPAMRPYRSVERIQHNRDECRLVIARAWSEALSWRTRWSNYKELFEGDPEGQPLLPLFGAIKEAEKARELVTV